MLHPEDFIHCVKEGKLWHAEIFQFSNKFKIYWIKKVILTNLLLLTTEYAIILLYKYLQMDYHQDASI